MKRWVTKRCPVAALALLLGAAPSVGNEPPALPKAFPPQFFMAEAFEKGGAVQVRFLIPLGRPQPVRRVVERDGEKREVVAYRPGYDRWHSVVLEADGREVRAFDAAGKPIETQRLPKQLSKPSPVIVFLGGEPDPYYLRVLRPGTVVLTAPHEKLVPPGRKE